MRKPTYIYDTRAYETTLSRTFAGNQKVGLPSPVPTPKRRSSDAEFQVPPVSHSFIADIRNPLTRRRKQKYLIAMQMDAGLLPEQQERKKTTGKWKARFKRFFSLG